MIKPVAFDRGGEPVLQVSGLTKVYPGRPATTAVDLVLKIGTALLMTFAATLVLVHAEILARAPTMF